ncbi:hypothetical protein HC028_22335 [Planosporangium flavigriseum]|uniref:Uncharacterized protein n=1 Tax=Planosporangium flavigriseum TaxID=373681 RepID=A0A8J3LQJ2_9ACTN|nr:hypothetical protein [Planosporangium flavigriseum]NJC67217.1 hypothetical protein [Planosporangium flavigriseum]GIG76147.1 hypothetical protein Pfl04_45510 [Planosporangium flavigriseum]
MSLTGLPLLITGVVVTLVLAVATGLYWRWTARATQRVVLVRTVLRPLALLLTEAVAVATAAIGANRALEIYPSWSVLFGGARTVDGARTADKATTAPSAGLEEWLHGQAKHGRGSGLAFAWKPAEALAWRLPSPPVVAVPDIYFQDRVARFPVIVVVAPSRARAAAAGWDDDRQALQIAHSGRPAVVVFVRLDDPAAALPVLATALPDQLGRDLRVQPVGWAVAGVGPDQRSALDLLQQNGDRYRAAALVDDGTHGPDAHLVDRARHAAPGLSLRLVAATPAAAGLDSDVVHQPTARLTAALRWLGHQTPPPLASPLVDPAVPASGGTR